MCRARIPVRRASDSRSCATSCRRTAAGSSSRARSDAAAASRSSCRYDLPTMASVLVVDDEKNIRSHLATYLGSIGHRVVLAESGSQALRSADAEPFDLVLSDVRMAGM